MIENRISCICPTLNVLNELKVSMQCFVNQTHEDKELLILFYDHDTETKEYLLSLDKDWLKENNIRLFKYENTENVNLGALKSYLIEQSTGQYCAIWDSDDWSADNRLELQLKALKENNCVSCTLSGTLVYSQKHKDLRIGFKRPESGIEGTMVFEKDYFPQYENLVRNFDTMALVYLFDKGVNYVLDKPDLYVYRIYTNHNNSTSNHLDELYNLSETSKEDLSNIIKFIDNE